MEMNVGKVKSKKAVRNYEREENVGERGEEL